MPQNSQRLGCDVVVQELLAYAVAFRIDMCREEAGEAIRRFEDVVHETSAPGKEQAGKGVNANGNSGKPAGDHGEEACLWGDGMDDGGLFFAKQSVEPEQGDAVRKKPNGAGDIYFLRSDSCLPNLFVPLSRGGNADDVIPLRHKLHLFSQKGIEGGGRGHNSYQFRACHRLGDHCGCV